MLIDRGLDGLIVHVVNDGDGRVVGRLEVEVFDRKGRPVESSSVQISIAARGDFTARVNALFDGFRDLNYAYRFGEPTYDVVRATLTYGDEQTEAVHLLMGQARPVEPDIGLRASAFRDARGWKLEISTGRLAQWVTVDVPRFDPEDSWFHLAPGATRYIRLFALDAEAPEPRGYVRALNLIDGAPVALVDGESIVPPKGTI